jgi:hypothetical protein
MAGHPARLFDDVATGVGDGPNDRTADLLRAGCGVSNALPNGPADALGSDHCGTGGEQA